jgi:dGTPase
VRTRQELEKTEDGLLAAWAQRSSQSRGRLFPAAEHAYRTAFQRDRDRVIHSTAFRRLQYKTQVFVYHEGDHFRNRLTHTLEVAQIARTIARALGCNEDLTEAIVLAHDLGHTPFGHAGERALHGLMREHGGFEHNRQSLRLIDVLEVRSSEYRGLNLTQETRAGILKHGDRFPAGHPVPLPELERCPSLEAQIADAADEVAYHNHDIDDGLRSGLVEWDALLDVPVWRDAIQSARAATGTASGGDERVQRARAIVQVIDHLATDLIETSLERLRGSGVQSADEVRQLDRPVIGCSPETVTEVRELARFLRENLYRHHQVVRMAAKAERILRDLWDAYTNDPRQLPPQALERADDESHERCIADYLAGMTDRFAMDEHRKLFDPHAHV